LAASIWSIATSTAWRVAGVSSAAASAVRPSSLASGALIAGTPRWNSVACSRWVHATR